jgi:nucleoid DNA-binding protein
VAHVSKSDLAKTVAENTGLPVAKVTQVMGALLDAIVKELASGRDVRLTGYFSLSTKVCKPRRVRHPKTGQMIDVPARTKVAFSSGAKLRRWVETRLEGMHFYGKRRESDEIPREAFNVGKDEIAGALDALDGSGDG